MEHQPYSANQQGIRLTTRSKKRKILLVFPVAALSPVELFKVMPEKKSGITLRNILVGGKGPQ